MVTLVAFAPQSTRADTQVPFGSSFSTTFDPPQPPPPGMPFRGGFGTYFQSVLQFPYLYVTVEGCGNASPHLGVTSAFTDNQVVNLITGSATATYTLTGANGDTVVLEMSFQATQIPGGVTFAGDYTVTGGTGRFDGATGSGVLTGSAFFTGPNNGVGSFSVEGTISPPHHH